MQPSGGERKSREKIAARTWRARRSDCANAPDCGSEILDRRFERWTVRETSETRERLALIGTVGIASEINNEARNNRAK